MNYRMLPIAASLLIFGGVAGASTQSPSSAKPNRLDQIWGAIDGRVSKQIDIWFEDGDYPKSIQLLVFETSYSPHNYEAATNLGWMQENVEEWDAALATYKRYLAANPDDKDRALPEADYLYRRKQYAEIPALLEPVLKLKPHPNNFRILAHTYEKQNKLEDAKRVWNEYLAVAPDDPSAKVNLSRVEKKIVAAKSR